MDVILKYFTDFNTHQIQQLTELGPLYTEWNSKINVISRKDIGSLYEKHVLHSLSIAAFVNFADGMQVIDIGTGGGFPGVPLAIYFPEVQFHLVDSIAKKLKVVAEIAAAAGIKNVTTQHIRVEDIRNRKFDFAISRAVAPLKELWQWAKPLVKKGNTAEIPNGLISLKGGDLAQEIFESGVKPNIVSIEHLFKEVSFTEKYLLHIKA